MIGEKFTCAREGCDTVGFKTTHNQKYCSGGECTRIATNARLTEKYHERAAIKRGLKRQCSVCGTALSRYNENKICAPCNATARQSVDDELHNMLRSVAWL